MGLTFPYFTFNQTFEYTTHGYILNRSYTHDATHNSTISKRNLDTLYTLIKLQVDIFTTIYVVPGSYNFCLVQHPDFNLGFKIMDDADPLEHMVQEVAKFVNPKKEYAKTIRATKIKRRRPPRTKPQGGIDPPETKLKRKTAQDKATKKDVEGKKSDGWKAGAIAAGIAGVTVIGGIAVLAAAEMLKCDDATMTITSINPTGRKSNTTTTTTTSNNFFSGLFSSFANLTADLSPAPTTVDIKFTMNNDYEFNEGHDEVEISGTGTELDGMGSILIEKLVDTNTIRVQCASNDCSNIYATSGTGEPQCAIEDAINKGLKKAIAGPIDAAKDLLDSVFDAFKTFVGPIVIGICIFLILIIVVPLLFSMFKGTPTQVSAPKMSN